MDREEREIDSPLTHSQLFTQVERSTLIPDGLRLQVQSITRPWHRSFSPSGLEAGIIGRAALLDPSSVREGAKSLTTLFNNGKVTAYFVPRCMEILNSFASASDDSRALINSDIEHDLLNYYCDGGGSSAEARLAIQLAETLDIPRPTHYFDLARDLMTSPGIVIVGAGFSYDSYAPLLKDMEGIACAALQTLGISDPHTLYRDNPEEAWKLLGAEWITFQGIMSNILAMKEPAQQHHILAELFHDGLIDHIVSFNWDDLIEKAYSSSFGSAIPVVSDDNSDSDHALWKLHGDINRSDERWVFPFEEGRVFDSLVVTAGASATRTMIVGYKETEPIVKDKLISVLADRGGVIRIGPELTSSPPDVFSDNAAYAMKQLAAGVEAAKSA